MTQKYKIMRAEIHSLIAKMSPFDTLEREQIDETLKWIKSGVEIFRIQKPDVPKKHLVAYAVLFDAEANKILLTDHKKSNLWLPAGGHLELNEHPKEAVLREAKEELGIDGELLLDEPIFLTVASTSGEIPEHTDISLWYLLKGKRTKGDRFDCQCDEFNEARWFDLDNIPYERSDMHLKRFVTKLNHQVTVYGR